MLFQRLIWCALGVALLLGSAQSFLQRLQTVPIILAAEVLVEAKSGTSPAPHAAQAHVDGAANAHGEEEWTPAEGFERTAWTWVANVLHAFSMALFALAAMGWWTYRRGDTTGRFKLAFAVAASGWLSLHFWPFLGLHAEVPGMQAAGVHARQVWWVLTVICCLLACATLAVGKRTWKFAVAPALLVIPFIVGAPQHSGDALAGFSGAAHDKMAELGQQFAWGTTWLSISFWALLGILNAWAFPRWLKPVLVKSAAARS